MNDLAWALLLALGGAILAAHCLRMTFREVRTGVARTEYADCRRSVQPVAFWVIILVNAAAALLGAAFLVAGLALLIAVAK